MRSTKTKFRQRFNVYKSYFRSYSRKHNEGSLDKGKPIPQASFFGHFFENGHNGKLTVGIRIIDGQRTFIHFGEKSCIGNVGLKRSLPRVLMKQPRMWN